jgi:uncharacterized protein (DUF486 family)
MSAWPATIGHILPIVLLSLSNVVMTFAWYGHLKQPNWPMWLAILLAWGLAFFEYCLAVPANRIGAQVYSLAELKTIQEVLTLVIFVGFATLYMGETLKASQLAGFALIAAGAALIFFKP